MIFTILVTDKSKSQTKKETEKTKEEPSSLFQRQRVDMLLGELLQKFPLPMPPQFQTQQVQQTQQAQAVQAATATTTQTTAPSQAAPTAAAVTQNGSSAATTVTGSNVNNVKNEPMDHSALDIKQELIENPASNGPGSVGPDNSGMDMGLDIKTEPSRNEMKPPPEKKMK